HHWVLFFTNKGRVYRVKVHELPEAAKNARGTYVANVPGATFQSDEKIAAVLDLDDYDDGKFLVLGTKNGMVKKTALAEYDSPRVGLIAINLRGDDALIGVKPPPGHDDLLFISRKGMAVRFSESHVRPMGRQTSGVTAMRLRRDDQVLAMEVVRSDADLLVVTDAGYGKRTPLEQYARKGRGIQGVKTAELTEACGFIAGPLVVQDEDHIFLITDTGQIIRTRVNEVRRAGRATQGVRIMRLARTSRRVAAVAPVVKDEEEPMSSQYPQVTTRPLARPAASAMAPAVDRRARLVLRRLDPWSVLKFSVVFYFCLMLVSLLVFAVIWFVLVNMGVFTSLTEFAGIFNFEVTFPAGTVFRWYTFIGLLGVGVWR